MKSKRHALLSIVNVFFGLITGILATFSVSSWFTYFYEGIPLTKVRYFKPNVFNVFITGVLLAGTIFNIRFGLKILKGKSEYVKPATVLILIYFALIILTCLPSILFLIITSPPVCNLFGSCAEITSGPIPNTIQM